MRVCLGVLCVVCVCCCIEASLVGLYPVHAKPHANGWLAVTKKHRHSRDLILYFPFMSKAFTIVDTNI